MYFVATIVVVLSLSVSVVVNANDHAFETSIATLGNRSNRRPPNSQHTSAA